MHDVGKATTPAENWPQHIAHEVRGKKIIAAACKRLRVPNDFSELAMLCSEYHTHCHQALSLKPSTLLRTLDSLDAFRRPERFQKFLLACEADARGRTGFEQTPYPQAAFMTQVWQAADRIKVPDLLKDKPVTPGPAAGEEIRQRLYEARLQAIKGALKSRESVNL